MVFARERELFAKERECERERERVVCKNRESVEFGPALVS
jgi:hypothetical protein